MMAAQMNRRTGEEIPKDLEAMFRSADYQERTGANVQWHTQLANVTQEVQAALGGRVPYDGTADSLIAAVYKPTGSETIWTSLQAAQNASR